MGFSIATVAAAVVAAGTAVYTGEVQRKQQSRQLRAQKRANEKQIAQAVSAQKLAGQAEAKANRQTPDAASLLSSAEEASSTGTASTMLTGASGVKKSGLLLGKSTLLGGGS